MKTTQEYFKMSKEELQAIHNEYGYTREECMLLDASGYTQFYNNITDITSDWYISNGYHLDEIIAMSDGRFTLLIND